MDGTVRSGPSRWAVSGLVLACVLGSGCPHDEEPLRLRLLVVPATTQECGEEGARGDYPWGSQVVRLTILRRDAPVNAARLREYKLVCDKLFTTASGFDIPQRSGRVSLRVEVFDHKVDQTSPKPLLLYSGGREDVDLESPSIDVVLRPSAQLAGAGLQDPRGLSCAPKMRRFRAFHSATPLPNGQVLIVGGLVADRGDGLLGKATPPGIAATATVEYYDPFNATFRLLTPIGMPLLPRAFHQAVLLGPATEPKGAYQVLLLGGITPAQGRFAAWLRTRTGEPFLLSPDNQAIAAEPQLLIIEPGAGAEGDPLVTVRKYNGTYPVLFPAAGLFQDVDAGIDELMVGGGSGAHVGPYAKPEDPNSAPQSNRGFTTPTPVYWLELSADGKSHAMAQPARVRAGHAVARLDEKRYLIWGGNMDGLPAEVVEVVTREGENATLSTLSLSTAPESTAWHTLTPIGVDDQKGAPSGAVLWAGGYQLTDDVPGLRIAQGGLRTAPLHWLDGATPPVLREVPSTDRPPEPIGGYLEATRLADGGVLLSGGNGSASCPTSICPSQLLAVYDRTAGGVGLRAPAPRLAVARFGHRAVRLVDNSVLIGGGLTADAQGNLTFLNTNVIYNPRSGVPAEDAPLFREPGTEWKGADGSTQVCPGSTFPSN